MADEKVTATCPPPYNPGAPAQYQYPPVQPVPMQHPGYPQPGYTQPPAQPMYPPGQPQHQVLVVSQPPAAGKTERPASTYLVFAIVSTFFFFPCGIPAIFCAMRTSTENSRGNGEAARSASRYTLLFGVFAVILGVVMVITLAVLSETVWRHL